MGRLIGTDARISLADFAGEFHELEPWQRNLCEQIAAIPPDQRDRVLVIEGSAAPVLAHLAGTRGDRIIIDDPWADSGEPVDLDAARRLFTDRLPSLPDGVDPVIIMAKLHDEPALKLAELERIEKRMPARPREIAEELAALDRPRNRAERRAQDARQRKGRR